MTAGNGFAEPVKANWLDKLGSVGMIPKAVFVTVVAGVLGPPGLPINVALKIFVRLREAAPESSTPIDADTPLPNSQVYWALFRPTALS